MAHPVDKSGIPSETYFNILLKKLTDAKDNYTRYSIVVEFEIVLPKISSTQFLKILDYFTLDFRGFVVNYLINHKEIIDKQNIDKTINLYIKQYKETYLTSVRLPVEYNTAYIKY
jgi:hypothetical protein